MVSDAHNVLIVMVLTDFHPLHRKLLGGFILQRRYQYNLQWPRSLDTRHLSCNLQELRPNLTNWYPG